MASNKRVLVVEDEPDLAQAVHIILSAAGYEPIHARDGREAIVLLAEMEPLPAVILLDLAMPVMDGWHTLSALRADPRLSELPVVVVSAHTDERLVGTKALVSISKPYRMRDLLDAVRAFAPL